MIEDLFQAARRGAMSAEPAALPVAGPAGQSGRSGLPGSAPGWMSLPGDVAHRDEPVATESAEILVPKGDPAPPRRPARPQGAAAAGVQPATSGWRGRLRRLSGGLVAPGPSAVERRLRSARAVARSSLDRPLTVAFVHPDAVAGRTPLRVASTFGVLRGGSVAAWALDGQAMPGVPAAQEPPARPLFDLVAALPRLNRADSRRCDLAAFTQPRPSGVDVLPGGARPMLDPAGFAGVHQVLRRFYSIVCVAIGSGTPTQTWAAAADVLVVCCSATQASIDAAQRFLAGLRRGGHRALAVNAVCVVSSVERKVPPAVHRKLCNDLRPDLRAVIPVCHDRHLPAEERVVDRPFPAPADPVWTFVCASIIDGFVSAAGAADGDQEYTSHHRKGVQQ